jgi:hypothetical protein
MEVLGPGSVLRFGCFDLDQEAGELRRDQVWPQFDYLRTDPRLAEIERRLGLRS